MSARADAWWHSLSAKERDGYYRWHGLRRDVGGPLPCDQPLPFTVKGAAAANLTPAARALVRAVADEDGPGAPVTRDRGWVVICGRRWARATLVTATQSGALLHAGNTVTVD